MSKKSISKFFDAEYAEKKDKKTLQRERKRFTNQKSYYRVQARERFVDDVSVNTIIDKIDKSQSFEELANVKDFFKDLRTIRNPKAKDDLVEIAFTNIVNFLETDALSEAEAQDRKNEQEFWEKYGLIDSDRLSERIMDIYKTSGALEALNFMDRLIAQGWLQL